MATQKNSSSFDHVFPLGFGLNSHHKVGSELITLFSRLAEMPVLVDTAEMYGTEHFIKETLQYIERSKLFISTKVSAEHILKMRLALKMSLHRLGTEYVDLYFVHNLDPNVPLSATLELLSELKKEGLTRYIGLCNISLTRLKEALSICRDISAVQCFYSIDYTLPERAMLPYCQENNIQFIAYSPLKYVENKQQALRHVISHRAIPLVMTNNAEHLRENVVTVRQGVL